MDLRGIEKHLATFFKFAEATITNFDVSISPKNIGPSFILLPRQRASARSDNVIGQQSLIFQLIFRPRMSAKISRQFLLAGKMIASLLFHLKVVALWGFVDMQMHCGTMLQMLMKHKESWL